MASFMGQIQEEADLSIGTCRRRTRAPQMDWRSCGTVPADPMATTGWKSPAISAVPTFRLPAAQKTAVRACAAALGPAHAVETMETGTIGQPRKMRAQVSCRSIAMACCITAIQFLEA